MKIVLVEDDAAVAASLEALLTGWGHECLRFETGEAFLEQDMDHASCILMDVRLPGIDGLAALKRFRETHAQTPVVVMTGHGDISMAVTALHLGAQDFIEKPFQGEDLVNRIEAAVAKTKPNVQCRQKLDRLTPRETDVLRGVVDGHQNKIIAHQLGISQKTVELHRARVMEKTGSKSISDLIRTALWGGLGSDGVP